MPKITYASKFDFYFMFFILSGGQHLVQTENVTKFNLKYALL